MLRESVIRSCIRAFECSTQLFRAYKIPYHMHCQLLGLFSDASNASRSPGDAVCRLHMLPAAHSFADLARPRSMPLVTMLNKTAVLPQWKLSIPAAIALSG